MPTKEVSCCKSVGIFSTLSGIPSFPTFQCAGFDQKMNIHEMQGGGKKTLQTFFVYPNENREEIFWGN